MLLSWAGSLTYSRSPSIAWAARSIRRIWRQALAGAGRRRLPTARGMVGPGVAILVGCWAVIMAFGFLYFVGETKDSATVLGTSLGGTAFLLLALLSFRYTWRESTYRYYATPEALELRRLFRSRTITWADAQWIRLMHTEGKTRV